MILRWPSESARWVFKILAPASARGLTAALPDLGRTSGCALDEAELRGRKEAAVTSASLARVSRFRNPTGLSRNEPCSSSAAISSKLIAGIAALLLRTALCWGGTVFARAFAVGAAGFLLKNSSRPFFEYLSGLSSLCLFVLRLQLLENCCALLDRWRFCRCFGFFSRH